MISNHIAARLGLALFAAAVTATSASAASPDPDKVVKAPATAAAAAKASGATKYCVVAGITGSRLPRKECRTRADWMGREGFDPLAKK